MRLFHSNVKQKFLNRPATGAFTLLLNSFSFGKCNKKIDFQVLLNLIRLSSKETKNKLWLLRFANALDDAILPTVVHFRGAWILNDRKNGNVKKICVFRSFAS